MLEFSVYYNYVDVRMVKNVCDVVFLQAIVYGLSSKISIFRFDTQDS